LPGASEAVIYRFGAYSIDTEGLEISASDEAVAVQPQVFALLLFLIENRDRVVSKDAILDSVWGGRIVSDATLNSRINAARRAVGDTGEIQSVIKTYPRRGFRFVAEIDDDAQALSPESSPSQDKPSIAVLPFVNMSGDPEQEYFADGIAEDITTALSRFQWFFVIARNSSFSYKGRAMDVKSVAEDLGVQYALEGSVRKSGKRVRVTAQLIDAPTGHHVWAEKYDRDLENVFAVQDEIAESIAAAVAPSFVSAEERRVERKAPGNFDSWDYTVRGNQHLWRLTKNEIAEAKRLFQVAIDIDPQSSVALGGLSLAYVWESLLGLVDNPADALAAAHQAAQRAIAADQHDGWGHSMLGFVNIHRRQHDAAIAAYRSALDINPNLAFAEGGLGHAYGWRGDYDAAIVHTDKAARLSPHDPARLFWIMGRAAAAFVAGKYDEGVHWGRRLTETFPDFALGWRVLATCHVHNGNLADARAAVEQLLCLVPHDNLRQVARAIPTYRCADLERFLVGLRNAGLPES